MGKFSRRSERNMEGVHPDMIRVARRALEISTVDFGIPNDGGVRKATRQNALFNDGKSKADGYEKLSEHQVEANDTGYGHALDFFAFVPSIGASWDRAHLAMVAAAFLQAAAELGIEIKWGGLWRSNVPKIENGIEYGWDMAHVQLVIKSKGV